MKLSIPQYGMLSKIARGRGPFNGLSGAAAHGGAQGTLASLHRRGLIDADNQITPAGRAALRREP